jgi:hypothetical protein
MVMWDAGLRKISPCNTWYKIFYNKDLKLKAQISTVIFEKWITIAALSYCTSIPTYRKARDSELWDTNLLFWIGEATSNVKVAIPCISWATYLLTIYCTKDCSSRLAAESACKLGTPSWCPSSAVNIQSGIYARKVPPTIKRDSEPFKHTCLWHHTARDFTITMYSLVLWVRSIVVMQITQSIGWFALSSTFLW